MKKGEETTAGRKNEDEGEETKGGNDESRGEGGGIRVQLDQMNEVNCWNTAARVWGARASCPGYMQQD